MPHSRIDNAASPAPNQFEEPSGSDLPVTADVHNVYKGVPLLNILKTWPKVRVLIAVAFALVYAVIRRVVKRTGFIKVAKASLSRGVKQHNCAALKPL